MGFDCLGVLQWLKRKSNPNSAERDVIAPDNVRLFSYNSLRSATDDFHPSTKIGGGGFGVVYKGILRDGTQIAIKRLLAESDQGTSQFLTEINAISSVRHPNLVQLLGCCVEDNNRILVYEYMENNSLARVLLGSQSKHVMLDWSRRAAICVGTALGLAFLHEEAEPRIVHRDIKASNVLLDGNFHPKIGDFGLAKLFPDNATHVTTRVAGTLGYLAPEYALLGQLTMKADVYSFGVLILEVVSGKSSSHAAFGPSLMVLVEWAWKLNGEQRLMELVDSDLCSSYPEAEVLRFLKVGLFCTQAAPGKRPTMKQVVEMLTKDVNLKDEALTEPGVYRRIGKADNNWEASSSSSQSQDRREKQSIHSKIESDQSGFQSTSQVLPR